MKKLKHTMAFEQFVVENAYSHQYHQLKSFQLTDDQVGMLESEFDFDEHGHIGNEHHGIELSPGGKVTFSGRYLHYYLPKWLKK